MCRQCASGIHHQCLGVVYSHSLQEFRECACLHADREATEHATV